MDDRRKITGYLINPNYQGKFLLVFGAIGMLQTFVFFYAMTQVFGQIQHFVGEGLEPEAMQAQILQIQSSVYMLFGGLFILTMVVFLIVGFRFTHKTAGAVYHMQQTFDAIAKSGQFQEMHLRDGDFFREAESSFNKMVSKLKK